MYAEFNNLEDARWVFDKMMERNVVSWTKVIGAYTRDGIYEDVFNLFTKCSE